MNTSRAIPYPAREAFLALLAGFAFLATGLALAPPASSQVFSSAPYVAAPDPAVETLRSRLDALEGDLRKAIGRTEQLQFDLNQARKTAEDANAGRMKAEKAIEALTVRVEQLERLAGGDIASASSAASRPAEATVNLTGPGNLTGPATPAPAADDGLTSKVDISQLPSDEAGLMKEARNLLLAGDYPSAQGAFTAYLATYGKGENASEAQYMLGESLLYQGDYNAAASAYGKLLSDYPKAARGPEALVKLARSMRLMNKKSQACSALALMPKQFPKASDGAKQLAATEKQRSGC
jgi:tol-pal system protein YbgF